MGRNSLYRPYRNFLRETAWLLDVLNASLVGLVTKGARKDVFRLSGEMAVLRLLDAWSRFCREVIIMSAACKPHTAAGFRLPRAPGIQRRSDVIPMLLNSYKRRSYEPHWAVAGECLDAAQRLRVPNLSTLSAAIGATNSPADELRYVRNFFAHRGEKSAGQIRAPGFFKLGSPLNLEYLVGEIVSPGTTRMESWITGLGVVAEAAIQ